MPATGELIRSMNYVEDITTTLRRICISIPAMPPDERQRLAESLRAAGAAIAAAGTVAVVCSQIFKVVSENRHDIQNAAGGTVCLPPYYSLCVSAGSHQG